MNCENETADRITPADYERLFVAGLAPPRPFMGVCGRVVRGKEPRNFERLTFASRRLAWVLGPHAMRGLLGRSGVDIVLGIGKSRAWLEPLLNEGMRWQLFVLPQAGMLAATWDNVLALVADHYPEVAAKVLACDPAVRDPVLPGKIDPRATTSEVKEKEEHALHMNVLRFRDSETTPENARLFLWHTLGINERFTGSGRTQHPDGSDGGDEYLVPNRPLAEFGEYAVIPLEVDAA